MNPEEKLNAFRGEMRERVADETDKQYAWEGRGRTGEKFDPDMIRVNPDCLTKDDMDIWRKITERKVEIEDWDAYIKKARQEIADTSQDIQEGRGRFTAVAGNMANEIITEKQLEEMDKA